MVVHCAWSSRVYYSGYTFGLKSVHGDTATIGEGEYALTNQIFKIYNHAVYMKNGLWGVLRRGDFADPKHTVNCLQHMT